MTTSTNTLLLSREQLHLHSQLKELNENEKKVLFKNMGSVDHLDDCKTTSTITDISVNSGKTPLRLSIDESASSNNRRHSIMKYRTHRDSLLAMSSSPSSSSSCDDHQPRKVVGFYKVEIREHAIIIGDNPGCVSGPPLSIDWPCEKKRTFDFEAYEANRPERRVCATLQMTREIRIKLFKSLGYSSRDIVRLTKPVNITRQQRKNTIATLQRHALQVSTEKITRGIKNALTLGRIKRQERKFLEPYSYSRTASQADLADSSSSSADGDDDDDDDMLKDTSIVKVEESTGDARTMHEP